jgi:threonine dehydrogenase-like Zn-dependent dehydrogenase
MSIPYATMDVDENQHEFCGCNVKKIIDGDRVVIELVFAGASIEFCKQAAENWLSNNGIKNSVTFIATEWTQR